MELSRLYMPRAMPLDGALKTSFSIILPSSPSNLIESLPFPGKVKSVALYWSPYACLPIIMGDVHPGTNRGTFLQIIGALKTTPPKMFLIVPLGDFHIFFKLNSSTLASSGVIVAHLTPTPYFFIALAALIVTSSLELSLSSMPKS